MVPQKLGGSQSYAFAWPARGLKQKKSSYTKFKSIKAKKHIPDHNAEKCGKTSRWTIKSLQPMTKKRWTVIKVT